MQAHLRIPLTKFAAVTAALACAGGGVFIGRTGATAATVAPLDHFLCIGHGHAQCAPVGVTLPDGTTTGVSDPLDRLVCDPPPRPRHLPETSPAPVSVTNELSPAGSGGPTPVPLVTGRLRWICTVTPPGTLAQSRPHAAAVALATYACNWVHYPRARSARFSQPFPVTVAGLRLQVGDPSRLCVPTAPAPAAGASSSLLCFHVSFDRRHHVGSVRLCVPSTTGDPSSGSTTTTAGTVGTAPSTTAASTTTTAPKTSPPTTASTTTTTTATTTTTRPATTTTTTRPATTTTTAPPTTTTTGPQPCPGIIVNGVCIITV